MDQIPAFAYAVKFAEISGLSVREVRTLCRQQVIPNEQTKKGFRIAVKQAMTTLENRALEFTGHAETRKVVAIRTRRRSTLNTMERLEQMQRDCKAGR
jgi:hypothetical protein